MHDSGSHTSSGDTSSTSHTSHTGHGFAAGQADQPFFTPNPADPTSYYGGTSARRRRGPSMIVVLIVLSAIMPIAFALLALSSH